MSVSFSLVAVSGALAVLFAVLMFFQRSLYSSAICLMAILLQIGCIYFLLGAQLLGLLQALIYAGAVMVLIVIAVMAAPAPMTQRWADMHLSPVLVAVLFGASLIELAGITYAHGHEAVTGWAVSRSLETEMAALLFGRYALMTEAVGVIILIAALAMLQEEPQ